MAGKTARGSRQRSRPAPGPPAARSTSRRPCAPCSQTIVFIVFLLILPLPSPALAQADASLQRLEEIESQIEAGKEKLKVTEERAEELSAALSASEKRRAELRQEARELVRKLDRLRRERGGLERRIEQLADELAAERRRGAQTSAWALSLAHGGTMELLLRGEDLTDRIRNAGILRATLAGVRESISTLAAKRTELERAEAALAETIAETERLAARRREAADEAQARSEQQQKTLALIRRDAQLTEAMLADLESSQRDLARLIADRQRGGDSLLNLDPYKGDLMPPVAGDPLLRYGSQRDPVFQVRIEHPGFTYEVDRGTPVKAVAPGAVVYAGWLKGYGNLVVLQHGNEYFTLYGYLDEVLVEQGQSLNEQAPVGLSGDSGSLYGPALHFEIRHRREPLDPADWLR